MRKLGAALTGIGFIGLCLTSGLEPDPSVMGAFYVHSGLLMIFTTVTLLGVLLTKSR